MNSYDARSRAFDKEARAVIERLKKDPRAYLDVSTAAALYVTDVARECAFPTGTTFTTAAVNAELQKHNISCKPESLEHVLLSVTGVTYQNRG